MEFSVETANDKLSYLKSIFRQRDTDFDQRDAIVELDHDKAFGWASPISNDDIRIATALPLKLTRHITGLFTQNQPRPLATPKKPSKRGNELSGQLERFLLGVGQENELRFGPVKLLGVENGGVRGWGSWRVTWNVDRQDGGNDLDVPIEWVPVDPRYLYYETGGLHERFNSCMYAIQRRRADVEREWGVNLGGGENPHDNTSDEVTYVDYWWWDGDLIYNAIWADETVLKPAAEMPGYRWLPYITWFTQPFHLNDPEYWGTGWVHSIRETIKNWDRAASRQMLRLTRAADNMYIIQQTSPEAQDVPPDWELTVESGRIKAVPAGWQIQPLQNAGPSPEANTMLQIFQEEIQAVGMPSMAMGDMPGSDTRMSGVTFHGVADAASTWLAIDVDSYARTLARIYDLIIGLCLYYSEDEKVVVACKTPGAKLPTVEMIGMSGKDMQGFRIDVVVDTETAADKMRKQQMGMQLLGMEDKCPFSRRTIQEKYFDIEDPEREEQAILVEYVERQDEMRQYLATLAARQYGLPEPKQPAPPQQPPTGAPQGMPPEIMQAMMQSGGMPPGAPGGMPGQMAMGPGGMPGQPTGMPTGVPTNLMSPQAMGGSPGPMPTPGMMPPGRAPMPPMPPGAPRR